MVQVDQLLHNPHIWRARDLAQAQSWSNGDGKGVTTGYTLLDGYLADGGWPRGGLTECLLETYGIGELRLLTPALRHLNQSEQRWSVWVLPPFVPYAPALTNLGLDLQRLLIVQPSCFEDALWTIERICQSGLCSSVLAWLDHRCLNLKHTQRLRLAAQRGQTFTCLFRPLHAIQQSSFAELRLALRTADNPSSQLCLDIIKRRSGWPVHGLKLSVEAYCEYDLYPTETLQQLLTEWRSKAHTPSIPTLPLRQNQGWKVARQTGS